MSDEVQPLPIEIREYDPEWARWYAEEVAGLSSDTDLSFHHIGSTSVPGCAAKPIIDIMAVAESMDRYYSGYRAILVGSHGYSAHGEYGVVGREFLTKYANRKFNLSVFAQGDPNIVRNLEFRERLRNDSGFRSEYVRLKRILAVASSQDMAAYNSGKSTLIARAIRGRTLTLWVPK